MVIAKQFWPVRAAATIIDWFGPTLHGAETDAKATTSQAWVVLLALNAAVALFLIVVGHGAGRRGDEATAIFWFWAGITLLLMPTIGCISYPVVARNERLILVVLLGNVARNTPRIIEAATKIGNPVILPAAPHALDANPF
jgi:hypothetical protein